MITPDPKCSVCGNDITTHHGKHRARCRGFGFCSAACSGKHHSAKQEAGRANDFLSKIDKPAIGCWVYRGHITKAGYGAYRTPTANKLAHRMMWEIMNGPIPKGMCVCHSCDNPPCCRPDHLWLGTQPENVKDMWSKGRGRPGTRRGELCNTAKLSASDILNIRLSNKKASELAAIYSVSSVQIRNIQQRKQWRHV